MLGFAGCFAVQLQKRCCGAESLNNHLPPNILYMVLYAVFIYFQIIFIILLK